MSTANLHISGNTESLDKTQIGVVSGDVFTFDLIKYYNKDGPENQSYTTWSEDGSKNHIIVNVGDRFSLEILSSELRYGVPNAPDSYGDYIKIDAKCGEQEIQGFLAFDIFFSFIDWEYYEVREESKYRTLDSGSYSGSFEINSDTVQIISTETRINNDGETYFEGYSQYIYDKSSGVLNYRYEKIINPSNNDEFLLEFHIQNLDVQQSSSEVDVAFLSNSAFYIIIVVMFFVTRVHCKRKSLSL